MRGDGEYRRRVNNDVELVLVFGAILDESLLHRSPAPRTPDSYTPATTVQQSGGVLSKRSLVVVNKARERSAPKKREKLQ